VDDLVVQVAHHPVHLPQRVRFHQDAAVGSRNTDVLQRAVTIVTHQFELKPVQRSRLPCSPSLKRVACTDVRKCKLSADRQLTHQMISWANVHSVLNCKAYPRLVVLCFNDGHERVAQAEVAKQIHGSQCRAHNVT